MIERMSSLLSSNPSESVQKRLYELLEQPQEPFLMEVYLLENGCSGRIIRSQSSSFCWPLNAAEKFGSHGGISGSKSTGFLRRLLVKLVHRKAVRNVLHLDSKTTMKKGSSFFDFFSVESKDQLSPVSVLELQHSDESSSPFDKQNECPLPSTMDSPRESSIISNETHAESLSRKKSKLSNRRKLLLGCLRETKERIKVIVREERSQLNPESLEIGLFIESAILDDLKEETILCMLSSKTML